VNDRKQIGRCWLTSDRRNTLSQAKAGTLRRSIPPRRRDREHNGRRVNQQNYEGHQPPDDGLGVSAELGRQEARRAGLRGHPWPSAARRARSPCRPTSTSAASWRAMALRRLSCASDATMRRLALAGRMRATAFAISSSWLSISAILSGAGRSSRRGRPCDRSPCRWATSRCRARRRSRADGGAQLCADPARAHGVSELRHVMVTPEGPYDDCRG